MVNISWAPRRRLGATAVAAAVGCTTVSFMWWRMKRRERASAAIRRHLLWDREQDRRQLTEASKDHPCIGEGDGRDDEDGCDAIAANVIFGTRSGISEFIAMLFPAVYFGKTWAKKTKRLRRTTSKKKLQDLARIERKSNSDLAALGRDPPAIQPSICFQGSGCVIVYHVGVARYLQEHFYLDESEGVTFLAASGGSIVAAMLALNMPMEVAMHENLRLATLSRRSPFGPFGRILDDVADAFEALLQHWTDDDVWRVTRGESLGGGGDAGCATLPEPGSGELAVQRRTFGKLPSGRDLKQPPPLPPPPLKTSHSPTTLQSSLPAPRLILSLTHGSTLSPRLMRHFPTKETLISTVYSSMNLPIFLCPFRPVVGEYYVDGGLTNNSPVTTAHTVRVSPTDRTADITPDRPATAAEFLVPGDDEFMRQMHEEGYQNAKKNHHLFVARGFRPRV